jgi:predicted dehydrogenase
MTCFNYRFIPAVRLAKNIIDEGRIGTIYQFRGRYLQQSGHNPDEALDNVKYATSKGSGIMLGIGSHIIDLARFLVGDIQSVCGRSKTFTTSRKTISGEDKPVDSDEGNVALVEFENGAIGTIESSGVSTGRKNQNTWEINGSKGSILFDLEDLNHLYVHLEDEQLEDVRGFTQISVTEPFHPYACTILPRGHNAGWEYGHVHALSHFVNCVVNDLPVAPDGATLEDGYRVQVIMETLKESSKTGKRLIPTF